MVKQYEANHSSHNLVRLGREMLHMGTEYVELLGGFVLLFAALLCLINMISSAINKLTDAHISMILSTSFSARKATFTSTRLQIGTLTALGLTILVVSDVLSTLSKDPSEYDWNELGKIGSIAAFRTALAFFLGIEKHEVAAEEKEEQELDSDREYEHRKQIENSPLTEGRVKKNQRISRSTNSKHE